MNSQIEINEEFRSLIQPLRKDEFASLEQSILTEGCRDSLVLWGDVLLDGHNRLTICQKHSLPFEVVQATHVSTANDAKLWILTNQLSRRNVNDFVRSELALLAKPFLAAQAKQRQVEAGRTTGSKLSQNSAQPSLDTRATIAGFADVSHDTLRKIEKVRESCAPSILNAARAGELSVNAAHLIANLPVPEQEEIARSGQKGMKEALTKIRAAKAKTKADPLSKTIEELQHELSRATQELAKMREELEICNSMKNGLRNQVFRLQSRVEYLEFLCGEDEVEKLADSEDQQTQ